MLADVRPEDILSQNNDLVKTTKINKEDIEDIIAGCAYPEGAQGYNIAKIVSFMTGMPEHVGGMTIVGGSSMQSIHIAAGAISMNAGKVFICCGIESMTSVPINGLNYTPHPELIKEQQMFTYQWVLQQKMLLKNLIYPEKNNKNLLFKVTQSI